VSRAGRHPDRPSWGILGLPFWPVGGPGSLRAGSQPPELPTRISVGFSKKLRPGWGPPGGDPPAIAPPATGPRRRPFCIGGMPGRPAAENHRSPVFSSAPFLADRYAS
jgi:hypothetical protein